jgi:hypothetical protein
MEEELLLVALLSQTKGTNIFLYNNNRIYKKYANHLYKEKNTKPVETAGKPKNKD